MYNQFQSYHDEAILLDENDNLIESQLKIKNKIIRAILKKNVIDISMSGKMFGEGQIGVGNRVRLMFLGSSPNDNGDILDQLDKRKSGDYLIMAISHNFKEEVHNASLRLTKIAELPQDVTLPNERIKTSTSRIPWWQPLALPYVINAVAPALRSAKRAFWWYTQSWCGWNTRTWSTMPQVITPTTEGASYRTHTTISQSSFVFVCLSWWRKTSRRLLVLRLLATILSYHRAYKQSAVCFLRTNTNTRRTEYKMLW